MATKYVDCTGATLTLGAAAVGGNEITKFSYKESTETRDIKTWATYPDSNTLATTTTLTGSFSYKLQNDEAPVSSGGAAAELKVAATGFNFEGDVVITDVSGELNVDGEMEISVDFKSSGAYTISATAIA